MDALHLAEWLEKDYRLAHLLELLSKPNVLTDQRGAVLKTFEAYLEFLSEEVDRRRSRRERASERVD